MLPVAADMDAGTAADAGAALYIGPAEAAECTGPAEGAPEAAQDAAAAAAAYGLDLSESVILVLFAAGLGH